MFTAWRGKPEMEIGLEIWIETDEENLNMESEMEKVWPQNYCMNTERDLSTGWLNFIWLEPTAWHMQMSQIRILYTCQLMLPQSRAQHTKSYKIKTLERGENEKMLEMSVIGTVPAEMNLTIWLGFEKNGFQTFHQLGRDEHCGRTVVISNM